MCNALLSAFDPETYRQLYGSFAEQNPLWNEIPTTKGEVYKWNPESTYIQEPPYFEGFSMGTGEFEDVTDARALAIFGDSVTTDHISPAGEIARNAPARMEFFARRHDYFKEGTRIEEQRHEQQD